MIILHDKVLVASLPDVARRAVFLVVVTRMSREQPLHPSGNVTITRGTNHEMNMVRHEARRQQRELHVFLRLAHQMQECGIVRGLVKYFGLPIRSIEHVIILTGKYLAGRARHMTKIYVAPAVRIIRI